MNSIRHRLVTRLIGWEIVLLMVGAIVTYVVVRRALIRQFDESLITKLVALTAAVEEENGRVIFDTTDQIPQQFAGAQSGFYFQVWDSQYREVARSASLRQELPRVMVVEDKPSILGNLRLTNGSRTRMAGYTFDPSTSDSARSGQFKTRAIAVVAADRRSLDATLVDVALMLGGSGGVVLLLTSIMVPWVLKREFIPLHLLAEQARQMDVESTVEGFSTAALPSELIPIARRLNDLMSRWQATLARERQFSDDLAHEFRTPIAELRSLAEVALKWPSERGAEMDRDVLGIAIQLETLINRLLAITRGDAVASQDAWMPVDVAALVESVAEPLKPVIARRKLDWRTEIQGSLEIHSDPVVLRSILTNLIENAVGYASEGGAVRVSAHVEGIQFRLSISNPAESLEATDLPRLFQRFWRKDPARSGDQHSGLGLSLARAFATSVGCQLEASLDPLNCLTLTLCGPTRRILAQDLNNSSRSL